MVRRFRRRAGRYNNGREPRRPPRRGAADGALPRRHGQRHADRGDRPRRRGRRRTAFATGPRRRRQDHRAGRSGAGARRALRAAIDALDVDVVIATGGTGITRRDGTYEVVSALLDKRIDGFGELFRALSYQEIGPAAMLSRACAGLARGTIVISLPGSENAVRLAMTKLVVPEIGHMVREARR